MWNAVETGDTGVAFSKPKTLRVVEWIKGEELETTNVQLFFGCFAANEKWKLQIKRAAGPERGLWFFEKGEKLSIFMEKGKVTIKGIRQM